MNENLDLTKILKDCPKGIRFYSPIYGVVSFIGIDESSDFSIDVSYVDEYEKVAISSFRKDGRYYDIKGSECLIYPSIDNHDWSKWKLPKKSKPKDDLLKGQLVMMNNDGWDEKNWKVGVYMGKGFVSDVISGDMLPLAYANVIPCESLNVLSTFKLENLAKIDDDNNYGTSYWDKFKEE